MNKEQIDELSSLQLDLKKIIGLPKKDSDMIISLFHDMMGSRYGDSFGISADLLKFEILYNTLTDSGFLITRRDRNIDDIL